MSRVLRFVWASLLALALPLQGLAAATMAACGPGHGGHGQGHEHAMPHDAQHAHGHGLGADVTSADDATADAATADEVPSTQHSQKCSVCASCCIASAGLPAHAVVAEPATSAESFVDLEPGSAPVFLTGGLERPPRSFLA